MTGMNHLKTVALLGLLSGLFVLAGYYLLGNEQGLYLGLAFAAMTSFGSWFYSDKAALAAYRAQPLTREQAPELYDRVARLSDRAGIPMPTLFVVPTQSPNAFATGRDPDHAAIAVTEGIVNLLSADELGGVLWVALLRDMRRNNVPIGGAQGFAPLQSTIPLMGCY